MKKQSLLTEVSGTTINTTTAPAAFPNVKTDDTATLLAFYNEHAGHAKPIAKFRDRATAEAKVTELIKAVKELTAYKKGVTKGEVKKGVTEKAPKAAKKEGEEAPAGGKGRKSAFTGKVITVATDKGANPRKEGTWGWKSFNLLKKGMTYEEYITAGGRNNDLAWDVAKGFVTVA